MSLIETLSIQAKDINLQLRIAQDTPAERDAALRRALQAGCRGMSSILLDPMFLQLYDGSHGWRADLGNVSKLSHAIATHPPAIATHPPAMATPPPDFPGTVVDFVEKEKQLLRSVGWHAQDAELIGEKLLNLILTPSDRSKDGKKAFEEIGHLRNLLCQLDPAPDLGAPARQNGFHGSSLVRRIVPASPSLGARVGSLWPPAFQRPLPGRVKRHGRSRMSLHATWVPRVPSRSCRSTRLGWATCFASHVARGDRVERHGCRCMSHCILM
jgi:hypothetical protein